MWKRKNTLTLIFQVEMAVGKSVSGVKLLASAFPHPICQSRVWRGGVAELSVVQHPDVWAVVPVINSVRCV